MVFTFESTYNSWMGAGLGALVGGLYIARVMYLENESPLLIYIGFGAVLVSIILFSLSFIFFKKNIDTLKRKQVKRSVSLILIALITILLIIGAILSLILIIGN